MSVQRCWNCGRLTTAELCSMCYAGMAGRACDPLRASALGLEEVRLGLAEMAAEDRLAELLTTPEQQLAAKAGPPPPGIDRERMAAVTNPELLFPLGGRIGPVVELVPEHPLDRLLYRFRRWLRGRS